jgi:hypothetical protein
MDKLNKRKIIILSIAALFLVYALYEILIASPASKKIKTSDNNQEISTLVGGLTNDLMKDAEAGVDEYIITRAEANWKRNPFWDRSSSSYKEWAATQGAAGGSGSAAKIIYSGYVDAGIMKIAIINGLEYRVGEQLEMEGYVLKRVTPSQVLIVNKNTGSEVEIPIQE